MSWMEVTECVSCGLLIGSDEKDALCGKCLESKKLKDRITFLEEELRKNGYSDTDLENDFLWTYQDNRISE